VHSGADLSSAANYVFGYKQDNCKGKDVQVRFLLALALALTLTLATARARTLKVLSVLHRLLRSSHFEERHWRDIGL